MKNISYECRVYESVDDDINSLKWRFIFLFVTQKKKKKNSTFLNLI